MLHPGYLRTRKLFGTEGANGWGNNNNTTFKQNTSKYRYVGLQDLAHWNLTLTGR
jgi:hypothetical protein